MSTKAQLNQVKNGVVERALLIGQQQFNEDEWQDKSVIKLTEAQEEKLEQLSDVTGLSLETIVNLAIKYSLYYVKIQQVNFTELKDYPKRLGSNIMKVSITGKTTTRLQEANLDKKISECVVVGIKLLYKKLIIVKNEKTNNIKITNQE
ncbi:hypothetical protein DSM106972_077640 [Dulcicalothrix desertica PCC 7102]|uniref:Uncharacterized protein n=1 Tax=Dulcicalothrix desertica PCC 7102 TaxID=232991 RepID=A0A3S1ILX8_9CYAN|nr:hypothetical protein [Dulcicalothrix desertica]RUS99322.1 hypothetical protein DSM106972_077640 [Dulcicalothrix desertica PCC 7102]TWH49985.1 hypothetical protein CAL7102_04261 [Dulcicalothrix desertica PCC 7102]